MPRTAWNLERDLRTTWWIVEKVQGKNIYAQNLYAALCNNEFAPKDTWALLQNIRWHCTWRYAGGIIADIRGEGDYLNWYCSGGWKSDYEDCFCEEGFVAPEVQQDLDSIGWLVVTEKN